MACNIPKEKKNEKNLLCGQAETAFALGSKQKNRLGGRKEAKRALWAHLV